MAVPRLGRQDARKLISRVLGDANVMYGRHFREALADEGLEIGDALGILSRGQIYDEPEQDIKTGDWKYRIEGDTPDGKRCAIVFCFKSRDDAFLITIFAVGRR
jgi:hypothetical protein